MSERDALQPLRCFQFGALSVQHRRCDLGVEPRRHTMSYVPAIRWRSRGRAAAAPRHGRLYLSIRAYNYLSIFDLSYNTAAPCRGVLLLTRTATWRGDACAIRAPPLSALSPLESSGHTCLLVRVLVRVFGGIFTAFRFRTGTEKRTRTWAESDRYGFYHTRTHARTHIVVRVGGGANSIGGGGNKTHKRQTW